MCMYMCAPVYVWVCAPVYVWVCAPVCMFTLECIYVCMYVCMCVRVHSETIINTLLAPKLCTCTPAILSLCGHLLYFIQSTRPLSFQAGVLARAYLQAATDEFNNLLGDAHIGLRLRLPHVCRADQNNRRHSTSSKPLLCHQNIRQRIMSRACWRSPTRKTSRTCSSKSAVCWMRKSRYQWTTWKTSFRSLTTWHAKGCPKSNGSFDKVRLSHSALHVRLRDQMGWCLCVCVCVCVCVCLCVSVYVCVCASVLLDYCERPCAWALWLTDTLLAGCFELILAVWCGSWQLWSQA